MDPIQVLADHVVSRGLDDMPEAARRAAKVFILDTLAVGVAGSSGPRIAEVAAALHSAEGIGPARVWGTGERLPAASAALLNATQTHNTESDCLHERAVVHAMSVALPVAMAGAERMGDVSGERLLEAMILAVDVAASIGLGATSAMQFFRPATAGAFGGVAALGKLMGLDRAMLAHAFSIAYAQVSGPMQAHAEGTMLLPMQLGFNARNAVTACDLARAGVEGPANVLGGEFGFFRVIENGGDMTRVLPDLGRVWRVTELAHKPYPTGRATHGVIDACLDLRSRLAADVRRIDAIEARVPPLVHQLVARPYRDGMNVNYARLSAAYLAARTLLHGTIDAEAFDPAALGDPIVAKLARRVRLMVEDHGDPNALVPVSVEVSLDDGATRGANVETVYGNPLKPMNRDAALAKFRRHMSSGRSPIPAERVERLIAAIDNVESCKNAAQIVDLMVP